MSTFMSRVAGFFDLNPATLSGAIDIIVCQHDRTEDGQPRFFTTPWHVRFGKLRLLKSDHHSVTIRINGEPVNLSMKLDREGEGSFVQTFLQTPDGTRIPYPSTPLPN
eukprot:GABV01006214.1.p1 GENE.GABV01006214.1~~GABV01006214.1.p1  ORF type:complete len:108 (-),score=28.02 GABV01006214.1:11-334(-)